MNYERVETGADFQAWRISAVTAGEDAAAWCLQLSARLDELEPRLAIRTPGKRSSERYEVWRCCDDDAAISPAIPVPRSASTPAPAQA